MAKKNIYIIFGLGSDKSIFDKFDWTYLELNPIYISWKDFNKDYTTEEFAEKLIHQINEENPIILGASIGGILAVEIAKKIPTHKTFLLASIKTKKEILSIFKLIGKVNLHKLIPTIIFKKQNFFVNYLFSVRNNTQKKILKKILSNTNEEQLKWSIHHLIKWNNTNIPNNIVQINGNCEILRPVKSECRFYNISSQENCLLVSDKETIEEILKKELASCA